MSADFQFDLETAVFPAGEGRFTGQVSDQYNIGDKPNGGYLVAIAVSAMSALSSHTDPISVTTHFLRPGVPDAPADIETEIIRAGRTVTTARATLTQEGKTRLEVIAAFGDLAESNQSSAVWTTPPPELVPVSQCRPRSPDEQGVDLPILNRVSIHLPPEFTLAGESEVAAVEGWVRFSDDREPDPHGLTLFADAFPPPLFAALGRVGWVPTIELTVHVRKTASRRVDEG